MPQSLFKIPVHVVFSTKDRVDLIAPEIENEPFKYFHGIVENNGSKLIVAGGTANHVHLLISFGKKIDIPELVGDLKRDSSKWIKTKGFGNFYWQRGYGAFSIGQSQVEQPSNISRIKKRIIKSRIIKMSIERCCKNTKLVMMKDTFGV